MRLTFLGTGSAMPTGERFQTGLLLEGGDDRLLIDCGSGALHGLARTDVGYEGVDTVLLTHHHLDHVSDLLPLMKARWLAGEESLTVVGPSGTPDLVRDLLSVHEYMQDRLELDLRTIDPGEPEDGTAESGDGAGEAEAGSRREPVADVAGFSVRAMETRHSMPCLAYRFAHPDEPDDLVFSGDSEAFPALAAFADGAALLVHDCSFPDGVEVSNHPTPSALGAAFEAADMEVGRVYLTHLYPHAQGRGEEMLESIGEHYGGAVRLARDGLTVDVS